jgi:hypothetical protein
MIAVNALKAPPSAMTIPKHALHAKIAAMAEIAVVLSETIATVSGVSVLSVATNVKMPIAITPSTAKM